jgi:hypothetical protein
MSHQANGLRLPMAKRRKKPKIAWKVTFRSTLPVQIEMSGKWPKGNGYVNLFKTEEAAVNYKRDQLMRIRRQYEDLSQPLPNEYQQQINEWNKNYGEEKSISE